MIMVLLVGQSEAIYHLPKHLKHFMFLVPVLDDEAELCLIPALGTDDFPCGDCVDGLDELPPSFLDLLVQF